MLGVDGEMTVPMGRLSVRMVFPEAKTAEVVLLTLDMVSVQIQQVFPSVQEGFVTGVPASVSVPPTLSSLLTLRSGCCALAAQTAKSKRQDATERRVKDKRAIDITFPFRNAQFTCPPSKPEVLRRC